MVQPFYFLLFWAPCVCDKAQQAHLQLPGLVSNFLELQSASLVHGYDWSGICRIIWLCSPQSSHCLCHKLFVNLCKPSCLLACYLCNADHPDEPALTCSNPCVNTSLHLYGRRISNRISGFYLASMIDRCSLTNGSRLLIPVLIFHQNFKSSMTFRPACIASKLHL